MVVIGTGGSIRCEKCCLSAAKAARTNRIVEIKSALIFQPGPAALTDGLDTILWRSVQGP